MKTPKHRLDSFQGTLHLTRLNLIKGSRCLILVPGWLWSSYFFPFPCFNLAIEQELRHFFRIFIKIAGSPPSPLFIHKWSWWFLKSVFVIFLPVYVPVIGESRGGVWEKSPVGLGVLGIWIFCPLIEWILVCGSWWLEIFCSFFLSCPILSRPNVSCGSWIFWTVSALGLANVVTFILFWRSRQLLCYQPPSRHGELV